MKAVFVEKDLADASENVRVMDSVSLFDRIFYLSLFKIRYLTN